MKEILVVLLIATLVLPLSGLVVAAQPSDTAPAPLGPEDVTPLQGGGLPLGPGADLTLSSDDITFDPPEPTTADTITIKATIRNVGDAWAVDVVVRFFAEGVSIGDKTIKRIKYGQSRTASIDWGPVAAGDYLVTVVVEPDDGGQPNTASKLITVTEAGAPPPPPPPPPPPEENKWAVVIGIADYEGEEHDLWHPDEDAVEMRESLITKYGFPEENIQMLLNKEATAQAIVDAIRWLASVEDADDSVVFFFCGHGFRVADYERWDDDREVDRYDEGIVTYDFYGLPDGRSRRYVTLGNEFANFESQKFALIFGSCYSGGMFDDNDDLQASGRVICSACRADQYGWDYYELGNTLFGYYFVDEAVLQGHAEGLHVNGDGVSMEEALAYAYSGVTTHDPQPPEPQEPQIYDGFAGELVS